MRIEERTLGQLAALLPYPPADANKYTRGKVVFIGGCAQYAGAACLACEAAARVGAGYVEAHCSPEAAAALHARIPSVVARTGGGAGIPEQPHKASHPLACLVGSGMDAADRAQMDQARDAFERCASTLVIDGGALSEAASEHGHAAVRARAERGRATILTPHLGEAARLAQGASLAVPAADAGEQQLAAFAVSLACAYRATVLLKGPVSYVASPSDPGASEDALVLRMSRGTAALAKAGTGDVLAGMVVGMSAQGLACADACILAATLHAEAGVAASSRLGELAVCAEDVLAAIPDAMRISVNVV